MNDTNKFSLNHRLHDGVICIYLSGYLDAHTAPELENEISNLINLSNYKFIVNFKELNYISSAGLGVFMAFIEEIRDNEGDIKLTEMSAKVFSVFDLLGFPILFDIVDKDEEALEKFRVGDLKKNDY